LMLKLACDQAHGWIVSSAVSMMSTIYWNVTPCSWHTALRSKGTLRLHLKVQQQVLSSVTTFISALDYCLLVACFNSSTTLKMEAVLSSETPVNYPNTRCHISEVLFTVTPVRTWNPTWARYSLFQ
jgi:hypothetical protein